MGLYYDDKHKQFLRELLVKMLGRDDDGVRMVESRYRIRIELTDRYYFCKSFNVDVDNQTSLARLAYCKSLILIVNLYSNIQHRPSRSCLPIEAVYIYLGLGGKEFYEKDELISKLNYLIIMYKRKI